MSFRLHASATNDCQVQQRALALALAVTLSCLLTGCGNGPYGSAELETVRLDIHVRDAAGRFLADLRPEQLVVFDDGELQSPLSLSAVQNGRVRDWSDERQPASAGRRSREGSGRFILIGIDDLACEAVPAGVLEVLEAIRKYLLTAGTAFGVISTGPARLMLDVTYDATQMKRVLDSIRQGAMRPAPGASEDDKVRVALMTVEDATKALNELRGLRKAILLVTCEVPQRSNPTDESVQISAADIEAQHRFFTTFLDQDTHAGRLARIAQAASRANAAIHLIVPFRGTPMHAGSHSIRSVQPGRVPGWGRVLATLTGGLVVDRAVSVETGVSDILAILSDYYVYTYRRYTSGTAARRIAVECREDGATSYYSRWR